MINVNEKWNTKSTPDSPRQVIIQCKELPDPTFGYHNGKEWVFEDMTLCHYADDGIKLNVIAWMEMPDPYIVPDLMDDRGFFAI